LKDNKGSKPQSLCW